MNIKITLTEEQQLWLLRRMRIDWDEEINYQASNGEADTEYLEMMLECYIALLGKPRGIIDAVVNKEIIEGMLNEINELKHN